MLGTKSLTFTAFATILLLLLPGCSRSPSAGDQAKEAAQRPAAAEPTTAEPTTAKPAAPPAASPPPVAKPEESVVVEPMPTSDRIAEALKTKAVFLEKDPSLQQFFDSAHGYAIFPSVTKGGLIVHGASGKGVVFEQGRAIGYSTLTQGDVGATVGGQTYSDLIFFQTEPVLADFKSGGAKFRRRYRRLPPPPAPRPTLPTRTV